nr:RHS repeat-associated core domain-containing protein [Streptomyces sp. SID13031]
MVSAALRRRWFVLGVVLSVVAGGVGQMVVPLAMAGVSAEVAPSLPVGVGLVVPAGAVGKGAEAGYLPGQVKVSTSGEAAYDVALDVPAGPGGLQPSLGLHYSSRAGNGVAGVGWSVSGLSAIGRCGETVASEGRQTGVSFRNADSSEGDGDRFCLDGQKLVAVDGVYGASGTEYRTETESFTKVLSGPSDGSGPTWFKVWLKDGRVREYQPKAAPRWSANVSGFTSGAAVRFAYPVTQESDRSGNVIDYSYILTSPGTAPGVELLLDKVSYSKLSGAERLRSVKFNYSEKRADESFSWMSGVKLEQKRLLTSVVMAGPNPAVSQELWRYSLGYDDTGSSGRSRLVRVTRCGALGGCGLARTFKYSENALSFPSQVVEPAFRLDQYDWWGWTRVTGRLSPIQAADYNGDGADDLLYNFGEGLGLRAAMSGKACDDPGCTPTLITPLAEVSAVGGALGRAALAFSRPVDADGDGVAELYVGSSEVDVHGNPVERGNGLLGHWDNDLDRFVEGGSRGFDLPANEFGGRDDFADFDGDGRPEILHRDGPLDMHLNQGSSFSDTGLHTPLAGDNSLVDVNGDGRADLISGKAVAGGTTGQVWGLKDDGSAHTENFTGGRYPMRMTDGENNPTDDEVQYGDFNGDGLQDALVAAWTRGFGDDGPVNTLYIRYNTGNGFGPEVKFTDLPHWISSADLKPDNGLRVADMDGDGRSDVVVFHGEANSSVPVSWSCGPAAFVGATILFAKGGCQDVTGPTPAYDSWAYSQIGDFDGDGRPDFVSFQGDTGGDPAASTELRLFENRKTGGPAAGQGSDLLMEVSDTPANEANTAKWLREKVTYSTDWSDEKNAAYHGPPVTFPAVRVRAAGMMVVRALASWGVADPANTADIAARKHITEYSFENPVRDVQGRGFLGFSQMRVWEPQRPAETVTTFINSTPETDPDQPARHWYPLAGLAKSVRTAVPVLPNPPEDNQTKLPAVRVKITTNNFESVKLNGGRTHYTRPENSVLPAWSSEVHEWEQAASYDSNLDADANPRPRTHIFNLLPAAGPGSQHFRHTQSASQSDDYGNVTRSESVVEGKDASQDGGMSRSVTEFDHAPARLAAWQLSIPRKTTTTVSEDHTAPTGELTRTSTVDYEFDALGRPTKEWTAKASTDPDLKKTVSTIYGTSGEVTSVRQEAETANTPARQVNYEYTPLTGGPDEKIFPTQVWSPHNVTAYRPSVWTVWHPGYGVALVTLDINAAKYMSTHPGENFASTTKYDDLGRVVEQTAPGESAITTAYAQRTDAYGGVNGTVMTTTRGLEEAKTYSDNLGRPIKEASRSLDGALVASESQYDVLGRATAVRRPYFVGTGGAPQWITTSFDSLDRPRVTTHPDGTTTEQTYPGVFETRGFDEKRNESYTVTDLNGRTVTSGTVPAPGTGADVVTTFVQGPSGVLRTVDPKNTTSTTYDVLGRLKEVTDANTGTMQYRFNSFGDIRESIHVQSRNRQVFAFDDQGRTTDVADYADSTLSGQTAFRFDTSANGIGRLGYTTSRDGINTTYRYDAAGRPAGTDYNDAGALFSTDLTYTPAGRPDTIAYPRVAGRSDRFTVKYTYTGYGHLSEITDASPGRTSQRLWKTLGLNPDGNLTSGSSRGGLITTVRDYEPLTGRLSKITDSNGTNPAKLTETGYHYWPNGLLKQRDDIAGHRNETYTYDNLSRLTGWTLTPPTGPARTTEYGYDPSGNLGQVKRDGLVTETNSYNHTEHPNAISGHVAGGLTSSYGYDTQGRQTSGAGRALTYKNLSLTPDTITKAGTTWNLTYTADGQRLKKTSATPAGITATTYIGDLYEKRVTPTGTSHVFHINGPTGHLAQTTYTGTTGNTLEYTLNDPQQSTTTVTTSTGTNPQHIYYDPFGKRINTDNTATPALPTGITHAYTGHETDDEYGLINMKGRLYDPETKRFTTPDPHITNPLNPQNWNPYSYVNNNPTNLTDPTGYDVGWTGGGTTGYGSTGYTQGTTNSEGPSSPISFGTWNLNTPTPTPTPAISDNTNYNEPTTNPQETNNPIAMAAAGLAVKIFCGSECSAANAPESPQTANEESLTTYDKLKNAHTTATSIFGTLKNKLVNMVQRELFPGPQYANQNSESGSDDPEYEEWLWAQKTVEGVAGFPDAACGACAVAVDMRISGQDPAAVARLTDYVRPVDMPNVLKILPDRIVSMTGRDGVSDQLMQMGEGARAIVYGESKNIVGHWYNAVVRNGRVVYLDTMTGPYVPTVYGDRMQAIFLQPGERLAPRSGW